MDFVKIKLQNGPNETEYSDRGQLLNAVSRLQNAVKKYFSHAMNAFWIFERCVGIRGIQRTSNRVRRKLTNNFIVPNVSNC